VEAESVLTDEALSPIVDAAVSRWAEVAESDDEIAATLQDVAFEIADFDDLTLGQAIGDTILIDNDAAGYGWFVDETPYDDSEFSLEQDAGELLATADREAYGKMDLLTVVTHELGHELGLGHADNQDLMAESLDTGVRRLPAEGDITALSQDQDQARLRFYVAKLNMWHGTGDTLQKIRNTNIEIRDKFEFSNDRMLQTDICDRSSSMPLLWSLEPLGFSEESAKIENNFASLASAVRPAHQLNSLSAY
jgi:hypothetical protein